METPRSLGFRMPAEWEPQEAVWLSWPANPETWPECRESVQRIFAEIALRLSRFEGVRINLVEEKQPEAEALFTAAEHKLGIRRGDIRFYNHPTNDVWVRDHGPIYLKNDATGEVALTNWEYNGWGEKYPFHLDNQVPVRIARSCGGRCFNQSLVLEGGSVECNGAGDLLVTRDCLLHENRNPGLPVETIEEMLRQGLGVDRVHWLDGCIEGDDTDGHVDNLVRFFKKDGLLAASGGERDSAQSRMLHLLGEQCGSLRKPTGGVFEVVDLPLPEPEYEGGRRLPMSYLNFFVTNGAVLVPAFGQSDRDGEAASVLKQCFPGREIIPIHCRDLILEGGALHCLTQQVPQPM